MKTEFEELWSLIKYGSAYDISKIRLWYLDREGLRSVWFNDILEEDNNMIVISKPNQENYSYIPYYRIYAIDYNDILIFDRRGGYQGKKSMELPENITDS